MAAPFDALFVSSDDFEAKSQMDVDDRVELCCPLPFFLQDLCLLVVINELDCYPTELLAALPYWLRYRILNNVPALDLSRLESTPVASGVDTDGIWKSRLTANKQDSRAWIPSSRRQFLQGEPDHSDNTESPTRGNLFHLDVSNDRRYYSALNFGACLIPGDSDLTKHIFKDFEASMRDGKLSVGKQRMFEIVSDLLTNSYETDYESSLCRLISIHGNSVLTNLLTGYMHQNCQNPIQCNQEVWRRQATALVVKEFSYHRYYFDSNRDIQLTPYRHMHFYDKHNPVELLSTLCTSCQLRPHGVNICIDAFSQSFLPRLLAERLALDGGLTLPTEDAKCTSIVNCFLDGVVSLRLQCDKYGQIGLVVSMIKAAIANGRASSLKHFICSIPELYVDIIEPLCALFLLQNFHVLILDVKEMYPLTLSKLLREFITAPCPHVQKLVIHVNRDPQFQLTLDENQVASLDMNVPSCSLQHKVLKFSSNESLIKGLYVLLQFPTIRLKELSLFTSSQNFHLCAIHPDLQMTKLLITIDGQKIATLQQDMVSQKIATLQQDMVSLFGISSLRKICVRGASWDQSTEIKLGVVSGLRGRSGLSPLTKLSLEIEYQYLYEIQDFEILCDAIFSLPQLENLKLVLGRGFGDMISESRYEEVLYKCWSQKAAGIKLKSIFLQTYEVDLKQISLVTQSLSFSLSRRPQRVSPEYVYGGSYHDYDYYGGSDDSSGYDPWAYYDSDDY